MSLDFVELKKTLESLNAPMGAGKIFYVCPESDSWFSDFVGITKGVGQVFGNIQQAVDACMSGRGDTVIVLPGTYTQSSSALAVNKSNVTIMGLEGKLEGTYIATGKIDENPGSVTGFNTIDVTGNYVTISGITLANGYHNSGTPTRDVVLATGLGFTLKNCLVSYDTTENSALRGIVLKGNYAKVLDCRFDNCIKGGAAVFFDVSAANLRNPVVQGCHFTGVNKDADSNLAIAAAASHANSIFGLLIKDNVFDPTGTGGVYGTDEWYDLDNGGAGDYEGMMCDNTFGVASIAAAAQLGDLATTIHFIGNKGLNGLSAAIPS